MAVKKTKMRNAKKTVHKSNSTRRLVRAAKKATKKTKVVRRPRKTTRASAAKNARPASPAVKRMSDFERALSVGRPPNVVKLFPHSRALIVSGKFIDRALRLKGGAMTMAANARSHFIIRGVLRAAQRANAAVIIEIARSEGGTSGYCAVNLWNLAAQVDQVANELGITVPIAVHADHYGIKKWDEVARARMEIPTLFEHGITSIAIDASHLAEDENVLANLELAKIIPAWAGLETEVGEIKGEEGLSTPEEALFHIQALNANGVFPDWIALNNGTVHGIQESDQGIQVELTARIHQALEPYKISGAQHGTSGNNSERLRQIAARTRTTKANVATALQMLAWGVEVNDYGNARLDQQGQLIKVPGEGVTEEMWAEMKAYTEQKGWKAGDTKKLNLPFEAKLLAQPAEVRERMVKRVENFAYQMLVDVFNAADTAPLALELINQAGGYDPGPKVGRIEEAAAWTVEKIREKARALHEKSGPQGNFDD